jgi:hypothetical protein
MEGKKGHEGVDLDGLRARIAGSLAASGRALARLGF